MPWLPTASWAGAIAGTRTSRRPRMGNRCGATARSRPSGWAPRRVLVLVLLAWGLTVYSAEDVSHPNTLQINVTGQQWLWTFQYPGTGVDTRTLVLPVNRPVQFNVTSVDVTHGFWPAALGVQVDANPGVVTVIRATPDKLGTFTVRCSQLCGLYHSFMYAPGSVVTSAKFSQWLQSQGASTTAAEAAALREEVTRKGRAST